jgi:hypothetical protein
MVVFAVPPPRAIAAVAGDLVQIIVLLSALTIPLIVLWASTDWGFVNKLGPKIFENISNRRDQIIGLLISNMVQFGWSMILLVISKALFSWFVGKTWHMSLICRPTDALAGGTLFLAVSKARFLVTAIRHATWNTWTKSIVAGLPSVGPRPPTGTDEVMR